MHFGLCTSFRNAPAARAAGWDFLEEAVQQTLQGDVPDEQWTLGAEIRGSGLPVPFANGLVPGSHKIVGPEVNADALGRYIRRVIARAGAVGMTTLVFGSGAARNVPEGFDRGVARRQILDFLRVAAAAAAEHSVMLVIEPLNREECNIINSVPEAAEYARELGHPNVWCLIDTFHFWKESQPLSDLTENMDLIRHVHVADLAGRVPPGETGLADYRPVFAALKRGNYGGAISVEALLGDRPATVPEAVKFLRREWAAA